MNDLDAIDSQVGYIRKDKDQSTLAWALAANTLPKVVAQLRAARDVVEACRAIVRHPDTYYGGIGTQLAAEKALAAYDKVAGEVPR